MAIPDSEVRFKIGRNVLGSLDNSDLVFLRM